MFGIDDALLIPAIGAAVGGIANAVSTNKNIKNSQRQAEDAINSLTFNPNDFYANYKFYEDPELYETYLQDSNAYDDVRVDPSILYAQNQALDDLINLSEAKGLNAIDQQALQEIINEENRNLQGQNDRILQDAMQRGVYGSGLELAQRLQNAQSGANRMSNRDMEVMSQAQQRALDALSSYGNLASNIRTQDFNEQDRKAAAQNAINQFNVNQRTDANKGNVNNLNQVRQGNVDIYNKNQDANVQSAQSIYNNQKDKVALQTGQYQNNAQNASTIGKNWNDLIGGFSQGISSAWEKTQKANK